MTYNDLTDMQRYLVDEEAEHWQEGSLSRREFIRRVSLMLGGVAAASGVLLALGCDPNTPDTPAPAANPSATAPSPAGTSPYHVDENNPLIHSEMVNIPSKTPNLKLQGYLAYNAAKMGSGAGMSKPGAVLVMHENKGLTDYMKDVVRRIAMAGYLGLCVDLVSRGGGSAAHPDETDRTAILGQVPVDYLVGDLLDGVAFLKAREDANPDRLGAIGFCFGGGMTWRLVTKSEEIKAAVPFYGPNPPLNDVRNIKAAVLGIYGGKDTRITSAVPELESALKANNVNYQIKIYSDANHAFHNDTGQNYNQQAAKDAWELTLSWLGSHM